MTSQVSYNPFCCVCGKELGKLSEEEYEALFLWEGLGAKCFDCDEGKSLLSYLLFEGREAGDSFIIDDLEFTTLDNSLQLVAGSFVPSGQNLRVVSYSLSSSTYLNISPKKDSPDTVFFLYSGPCQKCGFRARYFSDETSICDRCDYFLEQEWSSLPTLPKSVSQAIAFFDALETMPTIDHVLQLALPFASDCEDCVKIRALPGRDLGNEKHWYCSLHRLTRPSTVAECSGCQLIRILGVGNYCDYHHSLLIEQHEDGSLGYGNER